MNWVFFSLLAATGYAGSNILDKLLIDKKFSKVSAATITAFAGVAGLPFLIGLSFLIPENPQMNTLLGGFIAGWLVLAAVAFYYKALVSADPALVITLFQMILPLNLLFGYAFFDERPVDLQLLGALIIFIAAFIVSLESKEDKWRLRSGLFLSIFFASILFSLGDVVFKKAAINQPFLTVAFAEYASSVVAGILLIILSRKIRKEIRTLLKKDLPSTTSIVLLNEVVNLGATFAMRFALTLGPIFLVQAVMGTQPIIVFILGATVATLFPKIHDISEYKKHWRLKVLAIGLAILGAILIQ